MKYYTFYYYDVWGNTKDGFDVNNVHNSGIHIKIREGCSDYQINRALKCRGMEWEDLGTDEFYGRNKKNGKPFGELRIKEETI